jgi:hypothetical protein
MTSDYLEYVYHEYELPVIRSRYAGPFRDQMQTPPFPPKSARYSRSVPRAKIPLLLGDNVEVDPTLVFGVHRDLMSARQLRYTWNTH